MKRFSLIPLLVAGLNAAEPYHTLFNDASDWKQAGPGSFDLKDSIATAKGGMGLWWYGKKEFSNACFEVQFLPTDADDNAGIFVRFPDPGNDPWVAVKEGYEIQIHGTEPDKLNIGAIYDIQPAIESGVHIGKWNNYKIITSGDQIAIFINNRLVNVFECFAGRGDSKGYIGLQNHDDNSPVQFRGMKVQELDSDTLVEAFEELEIPRSTLTKYFAKANPATAATPVKRAKGNDWYSLADHGPAFFQTYGDWFKGKERNESAIKGVLLSYSAIPDKVALFNTETLALLSATDQGSHLLNTPWAGSHGQVNKFLNKDSFLFTAAEGPVWADASGSYEDKRTIKGHGNFSHLKFNGYSRNGSRIILDYAVHGTQILDSVSEQKNSLVRHLEVGPREKALTVRLSDASSEKDFNIKLKVADGAATIKNENGSYTLTIDPSSKTSLITLLYADNGAEEAPDPVALTPLTKGGKGISPETFEVEAKIDTSKAAWHVDNVPVPPILGSSPYESKVRMSDIDFFSDGDRALLPTWDGDIWMISGLKDFKKLTWKRYATGFFEPLGLRIVDDVPHIAGRDGIWKTHDLNNDGEADKFEVFNNDVIITTNFHEFQFGLETDKEGNFYFAKASPVRPGGRGFDKILDHNGAFMKVSADGSRLYVIGTGLRAPGGIGVGPNGEITSGENEGTWQPCCKINYFEPQRGTPFFGTEASRNGNETPFTEPLCYLPMSVDNSGGGQIWAPKGNKMGFAENELIHLSYGQSTVYHVLRQKVSDGFYQGGVAKVPVKLASSAQRAAFHPDGSMYVVGFRGWQTNAPNEAGLQRLRRNEAVTSPIPNGMEVTPEGVKLTFAVELDDDLASDPTSFTVERWKYVRSEQYGSGEFSVDNPDEAAEKTAAQKESKSHRQHDKVKVLSAKLLDDKKSVLVVLEGHKPTQQLKLDYDLESADGHELIGVIHSTIHKVPAK
ncbi:MAG: DUF1080 domain-containing protein [Akkermansiaceae bacterium]|jgi:hypothetical protein